MSPYDSCPAMLDAGITDPESQAGKDFCIEHCPHPDCILFNVKERIYSKKKSRNASIIRLQNKGRTLKEIAKELNLSIRTVQRYLK